MHSDGQNSEFLSAELDTLVTTTYTAQKKNNFNNQYDRNQWRHFCAKVT
jgi:hypothetical protein